MIRTVPFHYGIFYHAMVGLLERDPDEKYCFGFDGMYTFRYEPKNEVEKKRFAKDVVTLQEWLSMFELTPLLSRCEYGRLPHPHEGEENKDYLDIKIVHPVERGEKQR